MTPHPIIRIQRLPHAKDLELPCYHSAGSTGFDLIAAVTEDRILAPRQRLLVPTGIAVALPPGFEMQIRPRSGHALKHGITVLNAPGTVDSDYRGEIGVILIHHGDKALTIQRGLRIAQAVIHRVEAVRLVETDHLPASERGAGGFGSTGDGTPLAQPRKQA